VPLYEYECAACGEQFDRLQRAGAATNPPCPMCGAIESRRLISLVAGLGSRPGGATASDARAGGCGGACVCRR